jgi:lipopolysaccharide heptosyltransferase I
LLKPSSLGDIAQTLPVLAALRRRFPRAKISWVVNKSYASLLRPIPQLDEVIEFDRDSFRRQGFHAVFPSVDFLKSLAQRRFDLVIDLQGLFRSGAMAWATRATHRIGLASAREGSALFYTDVVDDLPLQQNAVERYWKVIEAFGMGESVKEFPLGLSIEERAWARSTLADLPRPILAIHAGARWATKRWPADRFAEAADASLAGSGSVLLVGGPGDEPIAEEIKGRLHRTVRDLTGKTNLRQLVAILEQVDLLLTNDSGPMHLAAALGTPTVSLFTCTDPNRAAPFGAGHRHLQTTVACKASYLKQCSRMDCMRDLTTDKLLPILQQSLDDCHAPVSCAAAASRANQPQAA